jgi:hypothetical protein|tara:strand:- start:2875 stop:3096 length:222 start_codon:yes stop_codon:yes gene_type:complete
MWLLALRKVYEAEVAETTAIIDTFLQKSVGVADHDNFMKTLKLNFDKMIHAKSAIAELDKLGEQSIKDKKDKK